MSALCRLHVRYQTRRLKIEVSRAHSVLAEEGRGVKEQAHLNAPCDGDRRVSDLNVRIVGG